MTTTHYILRETTIGTAVTVAVSVAVAILTFGGEARVALRGGPGTLEFDALPQTFFVVLMAIAGPLGIAARRRLARPTTVRPAVWIAVPLLALATAVLSYGVHGVLLPGDPGVTWPATAVYVFKAVYAAVVAIPVSALVLAWALEGRTGRAAR
ncbi:MAG: hypothetical protein ACFB50_01340 [Rubrobacteraceae bacterium]